MTVGCKRFVYNMYSAQPRRALAGEHVYKRSVSTGTRVRTGPPPTLEDSRPCNSSLLAEATARLRVCLAPSRSTLAARDLIHRRVRGVISKGFPSFPSQCRPRASTERALPRAASLRPFYSKILSFDFNRFPCFFILFFYFYFLGVC